MLLDQDKQKTVLKKLRAAYPDAKPALHFSSPYELLVATMLSAQCTDKQVNKCTAALFPVANTPAQIAEMSEDELNSYIRSCGFYRSEEHTSELQSR